MYHFAKAHELPELLILFVVKYIDNHYSPNFSGTDDSSIVGCHAAMAHSFARGHGAGVSQYKNLLGF